jgi:pimeloyl-ACP methyl ester carboxylesterase
MSHVDSSTSISRRAVPAETRKRDATVHSLGPHGFHRIAYTEWGDPANGHIVLCVPGLTRNRHDFAYLGRALGTHFRAVCMDLPGRGDSDWLADKQDYRLSQYQADAVAVIARATASRTEADRGATRSANAPKHGGVDWVGTSLGGLLGILIAAQPNSPIRRLVLNDAGPLIPWSAFPRLRDRLSRKARFDNLEQIEAHLRDVCSTFGELSDEQWHHLTTHSVRALPNGGYALDFDPGIIRAPTLRAHLELPVGRLGIPRIRADFDVPLGRRLLEGMDFWKLWDAVRCPTLVLRGALSDILTDPIAREMQTRGPRATVIEIEGVGHAPALMDESQIAPIRAFLATPSPSEIPSAMARYSSKEGP